MATEKVEILQVDTEPSKVSVKDLRKELKSLKDELLNLDEGTAEYNATLQKAAGIQHTLKKQMEEVNASAMDAGQILGNATKAVAGMTGAFQAGAGIMNMFGVESEASMEMLAKMQNVMAITQGFQAINDGIKGFKRLGIAIKSSTAAQKLFGDMQLVSAAKTKILELATKAWGKALIATGIGAIIVLIGTLIANLDKLTAAFESSSKKAAKAAKSANESMVSGLENEIEIMEASGASVDELYKKHYELYQMKRKQMVQDLKLIKDKNSEEYKEAKAALDALDQEQKVANAKYKKNIDDKHADEAKSNQKAIDDAKKKREQDAENRRKEREKQRKQDLENIDTINAELAAKRRTDKENELFNLTEKYNTQLALLEKYGQDTTLLTETYKAEIKAITDKYDAEEKAKLEEDNKKKSEILLAQYDEQVAATELGEQKLLATRMEMLANGQLTQQEFDDLIKQDADNKLNDEIENLTLLLENEELIGDERIALEEKLAAKKIELSQKVLDQKKADTEAEIALEQYKTDAMFKIAGALSGALNSAADLAEEGSKEQKALKISSAIIDGILGGIAAFTGMVQTIPGPAGMIAGALAASTVAISTAASIKKMNAVKVGKGGGGGGANMPSISMAGLAASQAPVQATTQVTGASTEAAMQDTRVYVVESDITNTQRKVSTAESEATF
jgi:hypothetical protein